MFLLFACVLKNVSQLAHRNKTLRAMKRIVLIIALLLAATTSFAQKRVILHKGDFNDEIYAIFDEVGFINLFDIRQTL